MNTIHETTLLIANEISIARKIQLILKNNAREGIDSNKKYMK